MDFRNHKIEKNFKIINKSIRIFELNLKDLIIYTELGSDDYMYTPIIAALANAKKVYARIKDSHFGSKNDLVVKFNNLKTFYKNSANIQIVEGNKGIEEADIILNSGFVRPINKEKIDLMKKTAVIPLMWETWEFRPNEIDFIYARKKEKLILGTYEDFLYTNNGFLITKLLFEENLGVYKDNILVVSSGRIGKSISTFFKNTLVKHDRVVFDKNFSEQESQSIITAEEAMKKISSYDAIIIAEHNHNVDLLSNNGVFNCSKIKSKNPFIKIIHVCGNIDIDDVKKFELYISPLKIAPFGHMSVGAAHLDSHAVLELNTAGLRVGEIMSRNRLKYDIRTAYQKSIQHKIVDDFSNGYFNYIPKNN